MLPELCEYLHISVRKDTAMAYTEKMCPNYFWAERVLPDLCFFFV